ncbi:hypothetical protein DL768_004817 [Monosporascus sp. mg162]|nr:hypothetical protein DL768_004817 [Monosporascus sp. mg162]
MPESAITDAGICGFLRSLRRVPRNGATPSAGSAARSPRSPSHCPGSAPTRTTRRSGGKPAAAARSAYTTTKSPVIAAAHQQKAARHAASFPAVRSPYNPSAGTGTSGSASTRTTSTRVNGGARGRSVHYMSWATYGEELFQAATVPLPRGGVEKRAWDDEKRAEREGRARGG